MYLMCATDYLMLTKLVISSKHIHIKFKTITFKNKLSQQPQNKLFIRNELFFNPLINESRHLE